MFTDYRRTTVAAYTLIFALLVAPAALCAKELSPTNILPSWNAGKGLIKEKIITFVEEVTDSASPSFVPKERRIATFDMDGTIICEKPYSMVETASLAYLKNVAQNDPDLRKIEPYKTAFEIKELNNTTQEQADYLNQEFLQILSTAYMNYSQAQFTDSVTAFIKNTEHPKFDKPYIDLVYRPMLELLDYLHANGFTVYVVSGSWQAFVRIMGTEKLNFDESRLIGSKVALEFRIENNEARFIRQGTGLEPANVGNGKAQNIYYHIGQQPIMAFGNSSGDIGMYAYTSSSKAPYLVLSLEHDDNTSEYSYPSGVDFSAHPSWHPVSMKENFKTIF